MKATTICDMLAARIDNEVVLKAKVHSVFKNACNLVTTRDEFITILNSDRKIYPMSLVIDGRGNVDFKALNIVQGMKFILHKGRSCNIDTRFDIDVSGAERWSSEPDLNFNSVSHESLKRNIKALERGIELYGKFSLMGSLVTALGDSYSCLNINISLKELLEEKYKFITKRFCEFINSIIQNDLDKVSYTSKKLIGFGIGLTPSMDDFISGLMISLIYLTKYYGFETSEAYKLNSAIISKGLEGTTRVSSEMLRFSALGKGSQLVKNLILALLCETEDYRILRKVKDAIDVGETSGTDTILGIYVGFKIGNNIKFRLKRK